MVSHENPERETVKRDAFKVITARNVHSDQFAVEVLSGDPSEGHWQYYIWINTDFQKPRHSPLHSE